VIDETSRNPYSLFALATHYYINHRSAQAQSVKVTFAVIGDFGLAGQNEADVANLVKSWNPDFIVTAGDNNYPDGAVWSIDDNIGQYYHDYIFNYGGKYGSESATRSFSHYWAVMTGILTQVMLISNTSPSIMAQTITTLSESLSISLC